MTDPKHPCALCRFKQDSLWQPVEGSPLSTLARGFVRRDLAAGEVVFSQGTPSMSARPVFWAMTMSVRFSEPTHNSTVMITKPMDTS